MKIALAQIYSATDNIKANLDKMSSLIKKASTDDCDLIIFPELAVSGYELEKLPEHIKDLEKLNALRLLTRECEDNHISSIFGYPIQINDNIYNTSFYVSPGDPTPLTYQKTHLIHILKEDHYFTRGEDFPQSFSIQGFKSIMTICYDLRFPELYRIPLLNDDFNLIINIAQWPKERIGHFTTLCQARAIENQSYLISVNGCGQYGDTIIGGHSTVYDPFGEILVRCGTYESYKTVNLDHQYITNYRKQFQPLKDIHSKWFAL